MGFAGKVKGRRKAPYPNCILDRSALTEALEEAGVSVKRVHVDAFYAALHRAHYPPLHKFVEIYRSESADPPPKYSQVEEEPQDENKSGRENVKAYGSKPLRNAVTNKRNKNKKQLPKKFLEYLATTEDFVTHTSRVKERLTSSDGSTTKVRQIQFHSVRVVIQFKCVETSQFNVPFAASSLLSCTMDSWWNQS